MLTPDSPQTPNEQTVLRRVIALAFPLTLDPDVVWRTTNALEALFGHLLETENAKLRESVEHAHNLLEEMLDMAEQCLMPERLKEEESVLADVRATLSASGRA